MNTRLVNTASGVILAALERCQTAAGIALALESAQLLMSPETAAELVKLRARVAELETERQSTNAALVDTTLAQRQAEGRLGNEDVTPQVMKLRTLLAGQREAVDGEHYSAVHHAYRVPRDLPETGGAK